MPEHGRSSDSLLARLNPSRGARGYVGGCLMVVCNIPEKVSIFWNSSVKALVSKWQNYYITESEFQEAFVGCALAYGARNGVKAYIIDASAAQGAMPLHIVRTMENEVFPTLVRYGVTHLMVVKPTSSNLTRISVGSYTTKAHTMGLTVVDVPSMTEAVKWLMLNGTFNESWAN